MRILFVHNLYSEITPTGEEYATQELAALLEENGHQVKWFRRCSDEVRKMTGSVKAFFTGIYNPYSAKALAKVLDDFRPDVVQVQNLYPLLSSSIFLPIKQRGIPVLMRCPNYRLFCPNGRCFNRKGEICEKCFGGKEWHCILNNCAGSLSRSTDYALRNAYTRASHRLSDTVDRYIVQSEFQKRKFVEQGIPVEKIVILPGICPTIKDRDTDSAGDYVSFIGRVCAEKGFDEFLEAAKINPELPFKVAGHVDRRYKIPDGCPKNVEFVGYLKGDDLDEFYLKSRIIVVPSKWYEGFPNVIVRGMLLKRPIITTNIGVLPSIIDNGVNGLVVESGEGQQLGKAIGALYADGKRCQAYGQAGREKAQRLYSREAIYKTLMETYESLVG